MFVGIRQLWPQFSRPVPSSDKGLEGATLLRELKGMLMKPVSKNPVPMAIVPGLP